MSISRCGPNNPARDGGRFTDVHGYVRVLRPAHPRSDTNGYLLEHIEIAEAALGRHLEVAHPVHHHNEIRSDNSNGNLVICEDKSYHHILHSRMRILAMGGDPDLHKWCPRCTQMVLRSDFSPSNAKRFGGLYPYCRLCAHTLSSERWAKEKLEREQRRPLPAPKPLIPAMNELLEKLK